MQNELTQIDQARLLRLPFDQYGRYTLIGAILAAARPFLKPQLQVLDVGGLAVTRRGETILPAQLFLPADEVTVLDVAACDLPGYVRGDGRGLDFADNAFDIVVSCDTLEHIPAADRPAFWRELLRVARHGVVLAAPFGEPETVAAEALLRGYIRAELGVEQPQLAEHVQFGLPQRATTAELLNELGHAYRCYPAGYVHAWLAMMLAKHTRIFADLELHDELDRYYNRFLAVAERREPAYRYVWAVAADGRSDWLAAVEHAIAPTLAPADATSPGWHDLATWLTQIHTLRLTNSAANSHNDTLIRQTQLLAGLNDVLAQREARIAALEAMLAQRDAQIGDLERRAGWLEEQARAARHALAAVEQGLVLRLLQWLGRK
ncbi:MAG: class I SAM-dependent methyltransferase [Oscillochloris sp.]|nr:class I SAM-dependent methyltransferase [Oscillochloris sp.]